MYTLPPKLAYFYIKIGPTDSNGQTSTPPFSFATRYPCIPIIEYTYLINIAIRTSNHGGQWQKEEGEIPYPQQEANPYTKKEEALLQLCTRSKSVHTKRYLYTDHIYVKTMLIHNQKNAFTAAQLLHQKNKRKTRNLTKAKSKNVNWKRTNPTTKMRRTKNMSRIKIRSKVNRPQIITQNLKHLIEETPPQNTSADPNDVARFSDADQEEEVIEVPPPINQSPNQYINNNNYQPGGSANELRQPDIYPNKYQNNSRSNIDNTARRLIPTSFTNSEGETIDLDDLWKDQDEARPYTLILCDVPKEVEYSTLVFHYGHLQSFDHTASRVITKASKAFVVFLYDWDYNLAMEITPPNGTKLVPKGTYNPRSISDWFFRSFSSIDNKSSAIFFLLNYEVSLHRHFDVIPVGINYNQEARCITLYWENDKQWLASHAKPGYGYHILYTAKQIESVGASPYQLEPYCADFLLWLILQAAKLKSINAPFFVKFVDKEEIPSMEQIVSRDQLERTFPQLTVLDPRYAFSTATVAQTDTLTPWDAETRYYFPDPELEGTPWKDMYDLRWGEKKAPREYLGLPRIRKIQYSPEIHANTPTFDLSKVHWEEVRDKLKLIHSPEANYPVLNFTINHIFADTNSKEYTKFFVTGYESNTPEHVLRRVLSAAFPELVLCGSQRDRKLNISGGYAFFFLKGLSREGINRVLQTEIPTRNGKLLSIALALKKKKKAATGDAPNPPQYIPPKGRGSGSAQ